MLSGSRNTIFVPVSLNPTRPLSRIELCHFSSYLLKTSVLVLIIMFIALKLRVLNHISLNVWYMVFWVHASESHGQKAAVTKLSKLSSHSHTSLCLKHTSYRNSRLCLEGNVKQLGNKSHDYFGSVWQQYTVNKFINTLISCLRWGWD